MRPKGPHRQRLIWNMDGGECLKRSRCTPELSWKMTRVAVEHIFHISAIWVIGTLSFEVIWPWIFIANLSSVAARSIYLCFIKVQHIWSPHPLNIALQVMLTPAEDQLLTADSEGEDRGGPTVKMSVSNAWQEHVFPPAGYFMPVKPPLLDQTWVAALGSSKLFCLMLPSLYRYKNGFSMLVS